MSTSFGFDLLGKWPRSMPTEVASCPFLNRFERTDETRVLQYLPGSDDSASSIPHALKIILD
jgi:hypothetical protein